MSEPNNKQTNRTHDFTLTNSLIKHQDKLEFIVMPIVEDSVTVKTKDV